jgi:hypothetical protein
MYTALNFRLAITGKPFFQSGHTDTHGLRIFRKVAIVAGRQQVLGYAIASAMSARSWPWFH